MPAIKTNQLNMTLDAAAFNEKFDVFEVRTSDEYFDRGAYILDTDIICGNISSVFFTGGKCFYVLMDKAQDNKRRLKEALLDAEGGDKISLEEKSASELSDRVILSLLLNAMGSYQLDFLRFNNLTGHLYCFTPEWIERGKKGSLINRIKCLEMGVTDELRLRLSVRTFTSELLRKKITFDKRKFEQYPKYTYAANDTLRRRLKSDQEPGFIMRQIDGKRSVVPFINILSLKEFEASKMGAIASVMAAFNSKYDSLCHICFEEITDYTVFVEENLVAENNRRVSEFLGQAGVKLVDVIGDEYSAAFCDEVVATLKGKYGVRASVGKRISKKVLNIRVIHNAAYYNGVEDPYKKSYPDTAVQHITLEDFKGDAKAAMTTVAHELLIKQDVQSKRITLFDWASMGISESITFGVSGTIDKKKRYFFMTIHPDGTFDFEERESMKSLDEYADCVSILDDGYKKDVAGVICFANGDINVIKEPNLITIPEIEKIHEYLSAGNTSLRGKEKRDELFSSITEVRMYEEDGRNYYFAGIIAKGMHYKIGDAANVRCVEGYNGAPARFGQLLPLMYVPFVRNSQLTVVPFPFKYLREYIQTVRR